MRSEQALTAAMALLIASFKPRLHNLSCDEETAIVEDFFKAVVTRLGHLQTCFRRLLVVSNLTCGMIFSESLRFLVPTLCSTVFRSCSHSLHVAKHASLHVHTRPIVSTRRNKYVCLPGLLSCLVNSEQLTHINISFYRELWDFLESMHRLCLFKLARLHANPMFTLTITTETRAVTILRQRIIKRFLHLRNHYQTSKVVFDGPKGGEG